jgi:hypothetical protein
LIRLPITGVFCRWRHSARLNLETPGLAREVEHADPRNIGGAMASTEVAGRVTESANQVLSEEKARKEKDRDLAVVVRALWIWFGTSVITLLLWALSLPTTNGWLRAWDVTRVLTQALIVAGACYGTGALVGFLFGIPRTLIGDANSIRVASNTNLEQVSDWLTKILVGVGLTQITTLPSLLPKIGQYFAVANSPSVTLAIMLGWGIAGFLVGYLLTRLFFFGAFAQVEAFVHRGGGYIERFQRDPAIDAATSSATRA